MYGDTQKKVLTVGQVFLLGRADQWTAVKLQTDHRLG